MSWIKIMDKLSLLFLKAASEMNAVKNEIVPFLAKEFGVNTNELFYFWLEEVMKQRQRPSVGNFMSGTWKYFFHGFLECNLTNISDKRVLRIEFGPNGRI